MTSELSEELFPSTLFRRFFCFHVAFGTFHSICFYVLLVVFEFSYGRKKIFL